MKLEAAIFVPYGGQHRLGVYFNSATAIEVVQSARDYDYKFSERVVQRGAPTLSELHESPKLPLYYAAVASAVKDHRTLVPVSDHRMRAYTRVVELPQLGPTEIVIEVTW